MDELLAPYREQIAEQARQPGDEIDQAILMWNVFYSVVAVFRERHPDSIFAERPPRYQVTDDGPWRTVTGDRELVVRRGA